MRITTESPIAAACKQELGRIDDAIAGIESELEDAIDEDRDPDIAGWLRRIETAVNRIDSIFDRECRESILDYLERTAEPR